jgi:dUTP pyrophosphatase
MPYCFCNNCECGYLNRKRNNSVKANELPTTTSVDLLNTISKFAGSSQLIMNVKRLTPTAKLPTKAHETDAGWDLYADIDGPIFLTPSKIELISTGISVSIPKGYCGMIKDRSSYGMNGDHVLAGIIDSSYIGLVKVVMYSPFGRRINPGDKFAQMLIVPVQQIIIEEVEELDETARGTGGFGSTGT